LILRTRINANVVRSDHAVVAFTARKDAQTQLPALLKDQQRMYLRELFANTFSLATLLTTADSVREKIAEASFADPTILQCLVDLNEILRSELDNTDKFRKQLHRLASHDDQVALLTRIDKGSEYYTTLLLAQLHNVMRTVAVLSRFTRTADYCQALNELDVLLMKKLADIGKAAHVARCILNGSEVKRNAVLDTQLKEQRLAIVARVRVHMAEHPPLTKSKSGRKRKKRLAKKSDA